VILSSGRNVELFEQLTVWLFDPNFAVVFNNKSTPSLLFVVYYFPFSYSKQETIVLYLLLSKL